MDYATKLNTNQPTEPPSVKNQQPMDPFFGGFLGALRLQLSPGSAEFGLGLSLFSLAVSIDARQVVEVNRFFGLSTFALASALRFLEIGWDEPSDHRVQSDVSYASLAMPCRRVLISIDPIGLPAVPELLIAHKLERFVGLVTASPDDPAFQPSGTTDLVLIDGQHEYEECKANVEKFADRGLRPGGYLVLHDYFVKSEHGKNDSPVKRMADELAASGRYESVLIDTHYQSFVIMRKR